MSALPAWTPVLTAAIVSGGTPLLIMLLARVLGQSRPLALDGESGAISPDRISAILTVAFGSLMLIGGIAYGFAEPRAWLVATGVALFGLAIGGFMSPSLTHVHDVFWDAEGIEGPSSLFGPTLGLSRTKIAWGDIVSVGETVTSYWFVQSSDRRRVYWSYLYKGHQTLAAAMDRRAVNLLRE